MKKKKKGQRERGEKKQSEVKRKRGCKAQINFVSSGLHASLSPLSAVICVKFVFLVPRV